GRKIKARILVEDPLVEIAQRATRLDAELLDERAPRLLVGGERLALTPRTVQREHQLRVQPLAERIPVHQRLELAYEIVVPTEHEVGFDSLLYRNESPLLQTGDLCPRERLEGDVGERRAPPQRKRLAQEPGGR